MFYRRLLEQRLSSRVSRNKIRLLFGARQTGKTELLRHAMRRATFFDLTATSERRRFEEDPARFGRELLALPERVKAVVVDEIQKVPALLDEIQSLTTTKRRAFKST